MIPFLDLKAQYKSIGPDVEAAVIEVLRRGDYVMGDSVTRFARERRRCIWRFSPPESGLAMKS
jgi:dTDP-4-amino-4,6-dideoxygalactose transaminase